MDFSKRSLILGIVGITATGVGVVTAAAGLQEGAEGRVNLQRGVRITQITVDDSGDQDANFERVNHDNTGFQAAVELNEENKIRFTAVIQNNATNNVDVRVQVDSPSAINTTVSTESNPAVDTTTGANTGINSTDKTSDTTRQVHKSTYTATLESNLDTDTDGEAIYIDVGLSDTATPGAYIIDIVIDPPNSTRLPLPWEALLSIDRHSLASIIGHVIIS